ncbi:phosphonate C-P lyase system protein PhnG [Tropicibacter sp. R15_0]|uniref:phosphonate C-P lyase system protein PhnG n=1 Tax=Tropicibacter sp. R15_0 TaxID=2821101 RepID=UPI001ADCF74C|nr:phosphonate C-P lyase system protein PhnG [Tropicibacter sp. R15_0]MBO9465274.1 phosphonate C-P lyase system protein PhnG [Tropicibacter sp. R15_0]
MLDQTTDTARRDWLSLLAKSPTGRARDLLKALDLSPSHELLRAPEIGSVMVRGRAGGTGAPFNLGEITVTRASLKLECGTVGHGYVQGRSKEDALSAALIDALMQTEAADHIADAVLAPLRQEMATRRATRAGKAAATKVEFFTMARGED